MKHLVAKEGFLFVNKDIRNGIVLAGDYIFQMNIIIWIIMMKFQNKKL